MHLNRVIQLLDFRSSVEVAFSTDLFSDRRMPDGLMTRNTIIEYKMKGRTILCKTIWSSDCITTHNVVRL